MGFARYYNKREVITGLCFVAPALIYMVAIVGYPMVYNVILSFQNLDVMSFQGQTQTFVGFDNYRFLLTDAVFLQAMRQTFIFTIACLIVQFSIGFLLSLLFVNKFPLAGVIRGTIVISFMMPMAVTGLIWNNMFQTNTGIINHILLNLRFIREPLEWLISGDLALISVIIANCWVGIPFNMLLLTAGMSNIPADVYESASIDGANWIQRTFKITFPLLKPAILAVLMLGFLYTFRIFDLVIIMTRGGPLNFTQVLSTYSYRLAFTEFQFSLGSAGAVILFLCLMAVGVVYLWLIRKEEAN